VTAADHGRSTVVSAACAGTPPAPVARLGALGEERSFLLRSLSDLEREHAAGDVDEADYVTLKDDYTIRAAAVLRALDASGTTSVPRPRRRPSKLLAAIAVTTAAGLGIGWLLSTSIGERQAGGTVTGGVTPLDDVQSLLSQARSAQMSDPQRALQLFTQAIDKDPTNVEARTYRGWTAALLALQADPGSDIASVSTLLAAKDLAAAVTMSPNYPDAQCFTAIVKFRLQHDAVGAKPFYDRCASSALPSVVSSFVSGLGADIEAALATSTTTEVSTPAG
jgi:hypothetical protein